MLPEKNVADNYSNTFNHAELVPLFSEKLCLNKNW